jgi:hypothetical protein
LVCISFRTKPSERHTLSIPSISNTNLSSQIVAILTVMLLKCLNRLPWNLARIPRHLRPFNGVHHKFLQSVIPTLQPFKLMKQSLNIAWKPYQTPWNFVCTSCHLSPFQWRISRIPPTSNTKITAFQIAEEKP